MLPPLLRWGCRGTALVVAVGVGAWPKLQWIRWELGCCGGEYGPAAEAVVVVRPGLHCCSGRGAVKVVTEEAVECRQGSRGSHYRRVP